VAVRRGGGFLAPVILKPCECMRSVLSNYTTEELETEIARRKHLREDDPPIKHCDECAHFVFVTAENERNVDFNPCSKGHHMRFQMPDSPMDLNWGFFRRRL
jgi:hypothetical protein